MANEDENVIFENSPLEKYLKEAGFVDFEQETVKCENVHQNEVLEDSENTECKAENSRSGFGVKGWILQFMKQCFCSDYHVDSSLLLRKEYTSLVFSSGIMSEDDVTFLQQFDPELFDIPEEENKKDQNSHNEFFNNIMQTIWTKISENILCLMILVMAVLLASNLWKYLDGTLGIVAVLAVSVIGCYLWHRQKLKQLHNTNIQILTDYVNEVKNFLTVFRKSIMLIQELELISKGYTLVGLGMHIGHHQSKDDEIKADIYPMLRQCLLKNGMSVLIPSCQFIKNMVASNPLAPEVNNVFTYISASPLSQFGLDKYCESEKLSLQYLKVLLSAIVLQQSELLSRYLLSMSDNTSTIPSKGFDIFHFSEMLHKGFYDQKKIVNSAFESLKLSYHLHKSSTTFSGNEDQKDKSIQHRTLQEVSSKWTKYYTAIHSLELHLKACLTRTQSISAFLMTEMESENNDVNNVHEENTFIELKSANKGLKMELDSCVSCLEESIYNLTVIFEVNESNEDHDNEDNSTNEIEGENLLDFNNESNVEKSEEKVGDCVFEAFTDIIDENDSQKLLTREELEKESRSREESKHLLVELKNVLLTKTKDPLITDEGFVKPIRKHNRESDDSKHSQTLNNIELECQDQDDNGNKGTNGFDKDAASNHGTDASISTKEPIHVHTSVKTELGTGNRSKVFQPVPCAGQYPSKAFSSAIQAAAMSRGLAMEESYGSSDSD